LALAVDQLGRAKLAIAQSPAHLPRHLQLAGHSTPRTDSQSSSVAVLPQNHCPAVVSNRRVWFESMELVRGAHVGRAHLSNRIDDVLSGQICFFSNRVIGRVMDVIFAAQVLLKARLRDGIAGAVELLHGGLEFFRRVSGSDQFGLYGKVKMYSPGLSHDFAATRALIALRRSQNSSPPKLTKMFAMEGVSF
jgi:hypothetical protein